MSDLVNKLLRPELLELQPYESARRLFSMADSAEVKTDWLNANENPQVPDIQINPALFNRYPDFQPEQLITAYSEYAGVKTSQVLASRGADEAIELLIRTFCRGQQLDNIVICPPTYGMYAISAKTHGSNVVEVPLTKNLQLDLPKLLPEVEQSKLVFICSPNNPTGDVMNRDDLITLLNKAQDKCLVVVDEAYIEFCPEQTVVSLLSEYPNLVITRTLSKAFGLAGIRCGFTLASEDVINALKKVIAPYPVPAPVAQIASDALNKDGLNWMQQQVTYLNALRDKFIDVAASLKFVEIVYSSKTNFVLLKLNDLVDAQSVMDFFSQNGTLLRNQSKQLMLDNTIRVSIGDETQMNKVNQLFEQLESSL